MRGKILKQERHMQNALNRESRVAFCSRNISIIEILPG